MVPAWVKGGERVIVLKSFEKYSIMLFSFCFWIAPGSSSFHWSWMKSCWMQPAYSEGTLPLHLFFSSGKNLSQRNQGCGGEFSVLSLVPISSVSGIFLHYWLCHMISCKSLSPTRMFSGLGTHHPPANRLIQIQSVLKSAQQCWKVCSGIEREDTSVKLATLNSFCILGKGNVFHIQLDMPQAEKYTGKQDKHSRSGMLANTSMQLLRSPGTKEKRHFGEKKPCLLELYF